MFALFIVIALASIMAGMFALIVREITKARRQQYLEEAALNGLACVKAAEFQKRAARAPSLGVRARLTARKDVKHTPARHPHSPMLVR